LKNIARTGPMGNVADNSYLTRLYPDSIL
jgi:hypothetical protein